MNARGNPSWRSGGPVLGRYYHLPQEGVFVRMAKALWKGLHSGKGGTYIRPVTGGYEYGHWSHNLWGWRFTKLGTAATMSEAQEGLSR